MAALQVLRAMRTQQASLASLRAPLSMLPQVMINVRTASAFDLADEVLQREVARVESELGDAGRVLLRASGTEPLIRVMVEGRDGQQVQSLCEQLAACVESRAQ